MESPSAARRNQPCRALRRPSRHSSPASCGNFHRPLLTAIRSQRGREFFNNMGKQKRCPVVMSRALRPAIHERHSFFSGFFSFFAFFFFCLSPEVSGFGRTINTGFSCWSSSAGHLSFFFSRSSALVAGLRQNRSIDSGGGNSRATWPFRGARAGLEARPHPRSVSSGRDHDRGRSPLQAAKCV